MIGRTGENGLAPQGAFEEAQGRYFLSHSVGLMPRAAQSSYNEGFLEPWRAGDGHAWDHWLAAIDRFRFALAPVLGAHGDDICPQTNVSSALAKIIFSLPDRARRKKIVLTEDDFPTIGFVAAQAKRAGYELTFLPGGPRLADIDAWTPAFHDDVQLVIAMHVFSNSGVKAPVGEICERARQRGVFSVLDLAQSAGAVPVELGNWRPDFAIGSSVKYLCGGPGAAYLWTEKETAARCSPIDVGWFSHEAPYEFDIHSFRYADGAMRFWGGTPSVAPFATASAGLQLLGDIGAEAVFAHNQRLLSRLISAFSQRAFLSHSREGERGSAAIVSVRDVDQASHALSEAGILHDRRAGGLRVSAHLYNTEEDVDALIEAVTPWIAS